MKIKELGFRLWWLYQTMRYPNRGRPLLMYPSRRPDYQWCICTHGPLPSFSIIERVRYWSLYIGWIEISWRK